MTALYAIGDFIDTARYPILSTPMPVVWYMIRMHPNYDLKAERQLHDRGISACVLKEQRTIKGAWNRRISRIVPMFPGAMFVPDFDADIARLKDAAEGIGGFVKYCGEALKVSLSTMAQLRRFEAKRNGVPEERKFRIGQKVRIIGGPFELLEARIDRLDSRYRVVVLIELLTQLVPIQCDEDQIEAV
jgi:transcription antitermination factor NusG